MRRDGSLLLFLFVTLLLSGCSRSGSPSAPVSTGNAGTTSTRLLSRPILERPELRAVFDAEGVTGTIVLFDSEGRVLSATDVDRARRRHLPASTFKIPNSTIGVETGVISGAEDVIPWDRVVRPRAEWNQDLTVRNAVGLSCVPCFKEIAHRIGEVRMQDWLTRLDYGNHDVSGGPIFWLQGAIRISPVEQVDFVHRLETGALPIRSATRDVVVDVLRVESGPGYVLRGKTGSAMPPDEPELIGWFVGWVERGPRRVYFATALDGSNGGDRKVTGLDARSVTKAVLRRLGVLPSASSTEPTESDAGPPREPDCSAEGISGRRPRRPAHACSGRALDRVTGDRDAAALKKIDEAINVHYLDFTFDRHLGILLGTSDACEDRCSAAVQAKVWMYAGIVYGSGSGRLAEAECAFRVALSWDPGVLLDEAIATDAVKRAFAGARRTVCGP